MGCLEFSHGYGKVPEREYSIEAIRKAHEFGCTLFDTAESYGEEMFYLGHNEELVGEAIQPFRKEAVLAAKMHLNVDEVLEGYDLYEIMLRHLQKSMKRLKMDYIDIYYLHRVNELVPMEDVAEVMGRFIKEGLVRGWGLSQVSVETLD